jgi:hypothetical protein
MMIDDGLLTNPVEHRHLRKSFPGRCGAAAKDQYFLCGVSHACPLPRLAQAGCCS